MTGQRFAALNPSSASLGVILVTGCAGFIGYHVTRELVSRGYVVIGIDNLNEYYDVNLKLARLRELSVLAGFSFVQGDLVDEELLPKVWAQFQPSQVIHLAAQAGVRYSLENPRSYIQSNIVGFFNLLEACRAHPVTHLLYASSSSVYGGNTKTPFEESDRVDHPVSLYAATKRSDELMAQTYGHLFGLRATGLRFFTVYGPFGRPDMAYFSFVDKYFAGEPIHVYNKGDVKHDLLRDFTYVDDVIEAILRLLDHAPSEASPHVIYNIGNSRPQSLMRFIATLEECLSESMGTVVEFSKVYEPLKPGDVSATYASTKKLKHAIGFEPSTPLREGLRRFTDWYVEFYRPTERGNG